jgi:hypothetical protein
VPAFACDGSDAWLAWWLSLATALPDRRAATPSAGEPAATPPGEPYRNYAETLRASQPPPALVAAMVFEAKRGDAIAAAREAVAAGEPWTYDESLDRRFAAAYARVFAAFAEICETIYRYDSWSAVRGPMVMAHVTPPEPAGPVARRDVCATGWKTRLDSRLKLVQARLTKDGGDGDLAALVDTYRSAAERERASAPPAAWVGISELLVFLYESRVRDGAFVEVTPAEEEAFVAGIRLLGTAADVICT